MDAIMYKSEDTGAPLLTGEYGSLSNLLTKVLVDGYGSMPSLGWTKEFEDVANNVVVFRMPSGSRTYLRVDDGYTYQVGKSALITAYESMSDVNTGIHPCPDPIETYRVTPKSYLSNDTVRGWRIIGDDKGFYWIPYTHGQQDISTATTGFGLLANMSYFGDYVCLRPDDPVSFCCIAHRYEYRNYLDGVAISSISDGFWKMRDSDNEIGYVSIGLGSGFYGSAAVGNNIELSPVGGKNMYTRTYIHESYIVFGSLPGYLNWIGKYPGNDDNSLREYYEYEGSEKVSFSFTNYLSTFVVMPTSTICRRNTIKLGSRFRDA